MVWGKFAVCLLTIFFAGKKVAKYGDIIAEKSGLGGLWIGLIVVALVTSLPELFTGISSVTIVDAPDLTVGNIFGANAFNLLTLALLDITHRNGSILSAVSPTHRLTGWLSLSLLLIVAAALFVSHRYFSLSLGWVGWYTPVFLLFYAGAVRQLFMAERRQPAHEEVELYHEEVSGRVYLHFAIAAVFIIGAGIWLAAIGDEIASVTGWGQHFVGSLLIAFTTTLPEITVSFAALRLGATDLAVANIIGSNMFNLTIIAIDDLFYLKGPVLEAVTQSHLVTAFAVILLTLLFITGMRYKPRRFLRLSWWNCATIALFLASAYFSFTLS